MRKIEGGMNWYAVRAVPGSQRMARAITIQPLAGESEEQTSIRAERRKGESILERDCRQAGIEVFMPGFWNTTRHQRTNTLIDRRYPFLVGYAFVCIERQAFEKVRKLDTVSGFVRNAFGPVAFDDLVIGELALAELQRKQAFEMERFERESLNRAHRRAVLNRHLGLILPKGRRKKIPLRMIAEAEIGKLTGRAKERVQEVLDALSSLDEEEHNASCTSGYVDINSAA